jgi:hypothetical protein
MTPDLKPRPACAPCHSVERLVSVHCPGLSHFLWVIFGGFPGFASLFLNNTGMGTPSPKRTTQGRQARGNGGQEIGLSGVSEERRQPNNRGQ